MTHHWLMSFKGGIELFSNNWKAMGVGQLVYFLFLGGGGESASGGAKGDGGESALELGVVVVYFLFFGGGGESASGGAKGDGGESALSWVLLLSTFFFWG